MSEQPRPDAPEVDESQPDPAAAADEAAPDAQAPIGHAEQVGRDRVTASPAPDPGAGTDIDPIEALSAAGERDAPSPEQDSADTPDDLGGTGGGNAGGAG